MSESKVLIGVPTAEYARRADFYDYFNALEKPLGTMITFAHGQSPARNRNLIIEQALKNDCTHILFLDDDIAFKPTMLKELLAHDLDIVSGIMFMRNYPHFPLIFEYTNEKGHCMHHFLKKGEKGLIPIVACGLGCVLIKIEVFKKMAELGKETDLHGVSGKWITMGELESDHWCDDISFFKRVRESGFNLFCDLDIKVGHIGSHIIWPDIINDDWFSTYDTGSTYGRASVPQHKEDIRAQTTSAA